jgi:hypothetical protein
VLHDEEVDGVFAADVVEGADVGMVEAGDGSCFAFEALGEAALAYLDGNGSVQPSVAGFVDFAHAACAERGDDFVRPQTRFCCDGHIARNDTGAGFGELRFGIGREIIFERKLVVAVCVGRRDLWSRLRD